jgi:hypothetical protein
MAEAATPGMIPQAEFIVRSFFSKPTHRHPSLMRATTHLNASSIPDDDESDLLRSKKNILRTFYDVS